MIAFVILKSENRETTAKLDVAPVGNQYSGQQPKNEGRGRNRSR
jgi:hypothetical protein